MSSFADWLQLLGYLFLVLAALFALFQLLPAPEEEQTASGLKPGRRRRRRGQKKHRTPLDWARADDEAEGYAPGHAERVARLSVHLATALGLPDELKQRLELAALLHDVGEIDFAPQLLQRPGPLSQAELFELWQHPVLGAKRALELTESQAVSQWVRWHHERWDGLGYPDGLTGAQIPLPARILRLADTADAMLHPRPYRAAFAPEEVAAEINRLAGVAYDPALTQIFLDDVLPVHLSEQEGPWR